MRLTGSLQVSHLTAIHSAFILRLEQTTEGKPDPDPALKDEAVASVDAADAWERAITGINYGDEVKGYNGPRGEHLPNEKPRA